MIVSTVSVRSLVDSWTRLHCVGAIQLFRMQRYIGCTATSLEMNGEANLQDVQHNIADVVIALVQWEDNWAVPWQWIFISECVGSLCHLLTATLTAIASISTCVPNVTPIKCRAHVPTLSPELDQGSFATWHFSMVAGSYQFCAELRNHHSGGWECIITLICINHSVFSFLWPCLTVSND